MLKTLNLPFVPMGYSAQYTYYLNSSRFFFPNFPEKKSDHCFSLALSTLIRKDIIIMRFIGMAKIVVLISSLNKH